MSTVLSAVWGAETPMDKEAIIQSSLGRGLPEISLTYAQLRAQADKVAAILLNAGVRADECVSVSLRNTIEHVVVFFGVLLAGATVAPLNPDYTDADYDFYMRDSNASIMIVPPAAVDAQVAARRAATALGASIFEVEMDHLGQINMQNVVPPRERRSASAPHPPTANTTGLFLHTSGTTGRPKGVPLTHQNLVTSLRNIGATYNLQPTDRTLLIMPLFHVHGLIGALLSTLASRGSVVLLAPRFSASAFWPLCLAHGCTWFSAVPTMLAALVNNATRDYVGTGKLRFIRSCSSPLPPALLASIEAKFGAGSIPVVEAYAMSENAHQISSNPLAKRKPGSVGVPVGVETAILTADGNPVATQGTHGEVGIRGPSVMLGYRVRPNDPSSAEAAARAFSKTGWFLTGDIGYFDAEGYLFLVGRSKELINRGGEKISPVELDDALLAHPDVAEAVAFAVPDQHYGQVPQAAVVLKAGTSPKVDEKALVAHCKARMAAFKVPTRIYVVTQLPKTATGKVQRAKVAEAMLAGAKAKL